MQTAKTAATTLKSRPRRSVNIGKLERKLSLGVGGALIAGGLMSRSLTRGLLLAAVGAAASYRGLTGHCHAYGMLGMSTARADESSLTFAPEPKHHYSAKTEIDRNRFEKLKETQVARGRDEEKATAVAAHEVKELRRREGRAKDEAEFIQDEFDKPPR